MPTASQASWHSLLLAASVVQAGQALAQADLRADPVNVAAPRGDILEAGRIPLDAESTTGSRLGLKVNEIPASVDVVGAQAVRERGFTTVQEALESTPGVIGGGSPGDPNAFSLRGFTLNQITHLYDGLRAGPPGMTSRPLDAYNFERIEILRGPASVLYGEGAVAGAINFVPKRPDRAGFRGDGLVSYGSYDTTRAGIGLGGPIGEAGLHYRLDLSHQRSNGWVDRTPYQYTNLTSALLWDVNDRLALQLSFDWSRDDISSWWGTPLVTPGFATDAVGSVVRADDGRTVDRRLFERNYNVADNVMQSDSYWTKLRAEYRMSDRLQFRNELYWYSADREWKNAESYTFDPTTSRIDRDRFYVAHDQTLVGDRIDAVYAHAIAGMSNRVLAGADVSRLELRRPSFFNGPVDSVDPLNPAPGGFGPLSPALQTTRIDTTAFFAEDVLAPTERLKLVGGLRTESIALERRVFDLTSTAQTGPGGGFDRTFQATTWRAGAVYEAMPGLNVYGQVSTGKDPIDTNIFLVRQRENFDLAESFQWEAGLKQSFLDQRAEWTLAYYDITRKNMLSRTAANVVTTVGQQSSDGIELSLAVRPTPALRVSANYAFTHARFDRFSDGVGVFDGKRPPNVPRDVFNLYGSYHFATSLPIEVGGSVRYVGERSANNANTVFLKAYTTADVFAAMLFRDSRLTFRVRNITDRSYGLWADVFYPDQVILGLPRTYEVAITTTF